MVDNNWLTLENCKPSDWTVFKQRLFFLAAQKHYLVCELGCVGDDPIWLLTPEVQNTGPHILVAAVFHGEEPAGGWGILRFLETASADLFDKLNIAFLPLVNPTGFRKGRRSNDWGQNPNSGFIHNDPSQNKPSNEGHILVENLSTIKSIAADGFVSLHEDVEFDKFYIYTFEKSDKPGLFSEMLHMAESQFFEPYPDGEIEGALVQDGIIFSHCDGSFEDLLFHEGIAFTACTETPGLLNINLRADANKSIISTFADFALTKLS